MNNKEIREDMEKYFSLGNIFSKKVMEKISIETQKLWEIQNEIEKKRKIEEEKNKDFKNTVNNLQTEILKNRIKENKTVNSIFADTIIYLLRKKGPLSTKEIHPLVQAMHPDICDDSIDRVINGQHFGKKWKHMVRNAQQFLKRKGVIELKNGKWYLTHS